MTKQYYRQRKPTIYKLIQEKGKINKSGKYTQPKSRCGKCKQPTVKAFINLGSIDGVRQKDIEIGRFCKTKTCRIIYQLTKIEIFGYE